MTSESTTGWATRSVAGWAARDGVVGGPFGSKLGRKDYQSTGVPVIRGQSLGRGRYVDVSDAVFVSAEKAEELSAHSAVPGDLVVTQRGTLGQVALVPDGPHRTYIVSQSQMRIRPGSDVNPMFLYYLFSTRRMAERIELLATQAGVPHINLKTLRELKVSLPDLSQQDAVAEVLSAIDDRIEWCRDGARRAEAVLLGVCRTNEGQDVPVSDMADYVNGGAFTKHADGEGRLVIRISELSSGVSDNSKYAEIDVPAEQTAYPGDILFSWSATLDVYRWTDDEAIVNQHIFKVVPSSDLPGWLVYAKLGEAMPTFQNIAHDRATTMGHIKRGHLEQVRVTLPTPERIAEIAEAGDALWEQHLRLHREARLLAHTRDALLPKLLAGEIRIEDPSRLLGAVA